MCLQRLAVVIAVDIADLREEQQFLNGAAAVAILLGPDAPLVLDLSRGSHMINTLDFYKPVVISLSFSIILQGFASASNKCSPLHAWCSQGWDDPFPLMRDGAYSIDCYMTCLANCIGKSSCRMAFVSLVFKLQLLVLLLILKLCHSEN